MSSSSAGFESKLSEMTNKVLNSLLILKDESNEIRD
jgi:hypothetical protein